MVTRKHVALQVKRLTTVPLAAPQSELAAKEVIEVLLRNCQGDEHVTEVVTRWLEGTPDPRNIVAELAAIARLTREPEHLPPGCALCDLGPHPTTGEQQWAAHLARDLRSGFSCACRCVCERGRLLAARDRNRQVQLEPDESGNTVLAWRRSGTS